MSARDRWVTFDCFGTLLDWQAWVGAVLAPLASDGDPHLDKAYLRHERLVERDQPFRSYKEVIATAFVRAARDLSVPLRPSLADAFPKAWASMRLFEDVEAMLAELRLKGWRLGVLTNCDDDLFEITHRAFRTPFDLFVTSERVRAYKPSRWHFRAFELMTGVTKQNWVHVANSWYHDIAPAQELGIRHVWLDREGTGEDAGSFASRVRSAAEVAGAADELVDRDELALPMLHAGRS